MLRADQFNKFAWVLTLAAIAVVVTGLYMARNVLVPLTLAALLSFLLTPVCDWLERRRLSRIPAVLTAVSLAFGLLGIVGWTSTVQMTNLVQELPVYEENIHDKVSAVTQFTKSAFAKVTKAVEQDVEEAESVQEAMKRPLGSQESPVSVRVIEPPANPLQIFRGLFGTMIEILGTAGIVIVLLVFFLIRREDLRDRFIHLVGKGNVTVTIPMLEDAAQRVSSYLLMLFVINVSFGFSVAVGLYFIGIPNALLWGILATILRFIPYIGPWIAAVMPIGLAMAISPGWFVPLLTVGLFVILELFSNNVLEPWLYGKNTGVSTVAVLLAAIFWMWLWGPIGLLLSTPLTVCLLVIGKHVPQFSFLDTLLGSDPVFEPHTRVYQRLLAGDIEEAADLVDEQLSEKPLAEVYDKLLLPALDKAQRHRHRGDLDPDRYQYVLQSMTELLQDRADHLLDDAKSEVSDSEKTQASSEELSDAPEGGVPLPADEDPLPQHTVRDILCVPARTEADEIAGQMLAQVLIEQGYFAQNIKLQTLSTHLLDLDTKRVAEVICVSATSPVAVMHARYLCRRLQTRFPQAKVVVGLWKLPGDLNDAQRRIGGDVCVVANLTDAASAVLRLVPLVAPNPAVAAPDELAAPASDVQHRVA